MGAIHTRSGILLARAFNPLLGTITTGLQCQFQLKIKISELRYYNYLCLIVFPSNVETGEVETASTCYSGGLQLLRRKCTSYLTLTYCHVL